VDLEIDKFSNSVIRELELFVLVKFSNKSVIFKRSKKIPLPKKYMYQKKQARRKREEGGLLLRIQEKKNSKKKKLKFDYFCTS